MSRGAAIARRVRSISVAASIVALIGTLVLWFVALFALDQGAKYGKISIPGNQVVHLPQGEVDLSFGAQLLSSGGGQDYLPIPTLNYDVLPVGGGLVPGTQESVGGTSSVNGNAHRRFAKLDVPVAGDYRVEVSGGVSAFFDPTLQLGAPNPASEVALIGGTVFFLLVLAAILARLAQLRLAAPSADGQASAAAALGRPEKPAARATRFPYRSLTIAVLGAVGLPVLLLSAGKLRIAPRGRVDSTGALVSGSASSSSPAAQVDLILAPLPRPAGQNVIGAASAGSLFRKRNFAPVLADLTRRLGGKSSITDLAVYPGEVDLVVDQAGGNLRRVRIGRDGVISEGGTSPVISTPHSIYLDQLDATVPQLLAEEVAARFHTPVRSLDRMVLLTNLAGGEAGWRIETSGRAARAPATFQAYLDGSNLRKTA